MTDSEPLHAPFRLPITYLSAQHRRPLSETLHRDLELVHLQTPVHDASANTPTTICIYERMFQPTHSFGEQMMPEWAAYFSTHEDYLNDTQQVLSEMNQYHRQMELSKKPPVTPETCQRLRKIWDDLHHVDFLEKYSYMEWQMLKPLNESSAFLQILSLGNLASPLFSLFIPILFLILPFILLQLRGIPLSWSMYTEVLTNVAKNHFIGKAILGLKSPSPDKILYVVLLLGFYLMQIYQNVVSCVHFYENVRQVNHDLVDLRHFCDYSVQSMDTYVRMHSSRPTYQSFCKDVQEQSNQLRCLSERLAAVSRFECAVHKLGELGTMMTNYHHVYSSSDVQTALRYAMGFEGYMNNLAGVTRHLQCGNMSLIELGVSPKKPTEFLNQYYPALLPSPSATPSTSTIVKNRASLRKNMIVTGPNASGKTTYLKTTAINVILTQQLGCGYYGKGSRLPRLYTNIHSYLNIPDTSERDSLFQAEARRCKDIIDMVEKEPRGRHFCIFDELYSGTNPTEATKAAFAFLKYLAQRRNVDFLLTTHYVNVCKMVKSSCKNIRNYKMLVTTDKDEMRYTYRIARGISTIEGAQKILKDMDYPSEIMVDFNA